MSGTVQEYINRSNRREYFKNILRNNRNITVADAIHDAYPRVKKSDPRWNSLMRMGVMVRKENNE